MQVYSCFFKMVKTNRTFFDLLNTTVRLSEHNCSRVLPEALGKVTSILAGNLGEVFNVARTW